MKDTKHDSMKFMATQDGLVLCTGICLAIFQFRINEKSDASLSFVRRKLHPIKEMAATDREREKDLISCK